jgi:hypothetical protein
MATSSHHKCDDKPDQYPGYPSRHQVIRGHFQILSTLLMSFNYSPDETARAAGISMGSLDSVLRGGSDRTRAPGPPESAVAHKLDLDTGAGVDETLDIVLEQEHP